MILYIIYKRPLREKVMLIPFIAQEVVILSINIPLLMMAVLDATNCEAFNMREVLQDMIIMSKILCSIVCFIYLVVTSLLKIVNQYKNRKASTPKENQEQVIVTTETQQQFNKSSKFKQESVMKSIKPPRITNLHMNNRLTSVPNLQPLHITENITIPAEDLSNTRNDNSDLPILDISDLKAGRAQSKIESTDHLALPMFDDTLDFYRERSRTHNVTRDNKLVAPRKGSELSVPKLDFGKLRIAQPRPLTKQSNTLNEEEKGVNPRVALKLKLQGYHVGEKDTMKYWINK
jgi:cell division protein FtsL